MLIRLKYFVLLFILIILPASADSIQKFEDKATIGKDKPIVNINEDSKPVTQKTKKGNLEHVLDLVKKNKEVSAQHKVLLKQLEKINAEKKSLSVNKKQLMEMLAKDPDKIFDEILHAYQAGFQDGLGSKK